MPVQDVVEQAINLSLFSQIPSTLLMFQSSWSATTIIGASDSLTALPMPMEFTSSSSLLSSPSSLSTILHGASPLQRTEIHMLSNMTVESPSTQALKQIKKSLTSLEESTYSEISSEFTLTITPTTRTILNERTSAEVFQESLLRDQHATSLPPSWQDTGGRTADIVSGYVSLTASSVFNKFAVDTNIVNSQSLDSERIIEPSVSNKDFSSSSRSPKLNRSTINIVKTVTGDPFMTDVSKYVFSNVLQQEQTQTILSSTYMTDAASANTVIRPSSCDSNNGVSNLQVLDMVLLPPFTSYLHTSPTLQDFISSVPSSSTLPFEYEHSVSQLNSANKAAVTVSNKAFISSAQEKYKTTRALSSEEKHTFSQLSNSSEYGLNKKVISEHSHKTDDPVVNLTTHTYDSKVLVKTSTSTISPTKVVQVNETNLLFPATLAEISTSEANRSTLTRFLSESSHILEMLTKVTLSPMTEGTHTTPEVSLVKEVSSTPIETPLQEIHFSTFGLHYIRSHTRSFQIDPSSDYLHITLPVSKSKRTLDSSSDTVSVKGSKSIESLQLPTESVMLSSTGDLQETLRLTVVDSPIFDLRSSESMATPMMIVTSLRSTSKSQMFKSLSESVTDFSTLCSDVLRDTHLNNSNDSIVKDSLIIGCGIAAGVVLLVVAGAIVYCIKSRRDPISSTGQPGQEPTAMSTVLSV